MEKASADLEAPRKLTKKIVPEKKEENAQKVTASPIADDKTTVKIFEMLEQAGNYKQLKKGTNEVIKILNKSKAEAVIMAADTDPLELLLNLPQLCEEKSVPYCFVKSMAALGRACGIKR